MYLLKYFCKHRQETKILGACANKRKIGDVCGGLNGVTGYVSGMGLWGQDADGYYGVEEVKEYEPADLEGNFQQFLDRRHDEH